jgi:hypothetical protein
MPGQVNTGPGNASVPNGPSPINPGPNGRPTEATMPAPHRRTTEASQNRSRPRSRRRRRIDRSHDNFYFCLFSTQHRLCPYFFTIHMICHTCFYLFYPSYLIAWRKLAFGSIKSSTPRPQYTLLILILLAQT